MTVATPVRRVTAPEGPDLLRYPAGLYALGEAESHMRQLHENLGSIRWGRVFALASTGVFLVMAAWEVPRLVGTDRLVSWLPFTDFTFYRGAAQHWLDTGAFYLPDQLAGPYFVILDVHVLYPPPALLLFLPFVWLPPVLWWVVPLGVVGYSLWRWRPAMWTWPLLGFIAFWPKTQSAVLLGNTDMWVAAGVAGGLLWGWPAALVVLKPTLALLALVGARQRSWWACWLVLGLVSLLMIPLWVDYLTVVRNSVLPWNYWVNSVPVVLAPVVAWLGRTTGPVSSAKPIWPPWASTRRPRPGDSPAAIGLSRHGAAEVFGDSSSG